MAVNKINGYRAPYRSLTFRNIADSQTGTNGVLYIAGKITQVGSTITIPAFTVIQQGLIYSKSTPTSKTVPTSANPPYYLVVTSPTPGNIDNLIFSFAQGPSDITENQVQLAYYDGGEWHIPPLVSIEGVYEEICGQNITTGRVGPYYGLKTTMVGTGYSGTYVNSAGALIDKMGQRQVFEEEFITPVVGEDPDWRRVDRILYRRPSDSPLRIGTRKFLLGGTYANSPAALYTTNLFSGLSTRHAPRVVVDSENRAHVFAASGTGGSYNLTYARLASDRQTVLQSETALVTGLADVDFDVVIGSDDYIHILYTVGDDIIYCRADVTGALGTPLTLTGLLTAVCAKPRAKLDDNGLLHIVFQGDTGSVNQIFYASVLLQTIATPPQLLVTSASNLVNPDIYVTSDFILYVAWENASTTEIYYRSFTTLLAPRESSEICVSSSTEYSEGGTLVNNATSPRIIVTDNQVPFIAFGQVHGGSNYGITIWSTEGARQKMLFSGTENFLYYDFHVEDIFNGAALVVVRSGSVDMIKLRDGDEDFLINLSVGPCNGVCLVKDRLGSMVVAWADDANGLYTAKTPAESYVMAYSLRELDSDLLLSRMIMPDEVIINWIPGDKPGSFYDFLLAYGQSVLIDWKATNPADKLTFGTGLNIIDLYTDTNYSVTAGSYTMLEGEALFVTLDGTGGAVMPQVLPLALVPWDSNAAVLGIIKDGEFNPVLLGMAGMTQLDSGESIIFGEDLPQSIRARLGIISETAYQAYTSTLAINPSDTYPQALSNLDIIAAQNRHARLVKFEGDWEALAANTLRITSPCYVQIPGLSEDRNTIAIQSILLANDGDIAYVSLNRTSGAASILPITVASASSVVPTRNTFIVARRTPTGVEVDGQAVTYTDRLSAGQINNVVVDGDPLEKAIKRLDVRQDVVKRVRVITRTETFLPTGSSATIDAVSLADGDKVLFANPLLNGIYQLSGVGSSLVWTKLYEFAGEQDPTPRDLVMVYDGAEVNRTLWAYDPAKSWYRATTIDDTVPIRAADFTTISLPSGSSLTVDGQTIIEGELVLYGNAALNRVYRVTGIGSSIAFEEMNVFMGDVAPRDGSTVLAQDGTVSDVVYEYDADAGAWHYLTLTYQNKTYLGLTSPDKSGGAYMDQLVVGQPNNVVVEGDPLEKAIKRLDGRADVVKNVKVLDLAATTLPALPATVDGELLAVGDKVLFGSTTLNGIYQVGPSGWSDKLYEFGGSQTPSSHALVLVKEGSELNRTIWQYDSAISPPWHRLAGAPENIWTGADAVTAPTFDGTLSPADTNMALALETIDRYFRSLQLREHPTNKSRVKILADGTVKTDGTVLAGIIGDRLLQFDGAELDFSSFSGVYLYAADGVTLLQTYPAYPITSYEYFWYAIGFDKDTAETNNTIIPNFILDAADSSDANDSLARRPTLTAEYIIGAVRLRGSGTTPEVDPILQGHITQISQHNNAAIFADIAALQAIVAIHTDEINDLQNALASLIANKPDFETFTATAGGQSIFDLTKFTINPDNTILDIYVMWNGRYQILSEAGDFSDGSFRKNSSTQIEMAEPISEGEEITVYIWDPAALLVRTTKTQNFTVPFGGQSIFTLNPLKFTVTNDNTVIDCEYYVNGRWQNQSLVGDFSDGSVRKNSSVEIETEEALSPGTVFTVVQRVPTGGGGGGGGGSTDLENISTDLGFITPKTVGTLTKPADSLILKDQVTTDIWKIEVSSGSLQVIKIG